MKNAWIVFLLIVISGLAACQITSVQPNVSTSVATVASATTITESAVEFPPIISGSIADVEKIAGFHIKKPTYLPKGVLFDFATYRRESAPCVTLHFKIIHDQYGDMGTFFQIMQSVQSDSPFYTVSCGEVKEGCEVLQIGTMPVVYRRHDDTEELDWYTDGYAFSLLRNAGEPGKVYKEDLMKVVAGLE